MDILLNLISVLLTIYDVITQTYAKQVRHTF